MTLVHTSEVSCTPRLESLSRIRAVSGRDVVCGSVSSASVTATFRFTAGASLVIFPPCRNRLSRKPPDRRPPHRAPARTGRAAASPHTAVTDPRTCKTSSGWFHRISWSLSPSMHCVVGGYVDLIEVSGQVDVRAVFRQPEVRPPVVQHADVPVLQD